MADAVLEHEAPSLEGISRLGAGGIKGQPERAPPAPAQLEVVHEVLPKHTLRGQGRFLMVI